MLSIGSGARVRTCAGWSRREFLRVGGFGLGALSLPGVLDLEALAATKRFVRDKSVVLLFLQGGPPQIELFDPKPNAPTSTTSCTGHVATALPGVHFGGTFPKLARLANRLAVVRSFGSGDGGHNQVPVLTGRAANGGTMGAHCARLLGGNHPVTGFPTHTVVLPEAIRKDLKLGQPTGPFTYEYIRKNYVAAGTLGAQCEAMLLDGGSDLTGNMQLRLDADRWGDRRTLLSQLDDFRRSLDGTGTLDGLGAARAQAYEVLARGVADAFDVSKEDPRTLAKYDTQGLFDHADWHAGGAMYRGLRNQSRITNLLGHQMLLARRLCEAGCGFVTVVDGCWDFHGDGNNPPTPVGMGVLGPQLDHALAAFLEDLEERGLSEKILLLVTGEMGRSPGKGKNGGTGHWGDLTPLLVAGGGLRMGQVIGTTDAQGGKATSTPYRPEHLLATVMQTLFDPTEARLETGLPGDLARLITSAAPIAELF
jgi:hypothetical protein